MIANQKLAITIPTYNRADFLDYSLEVHIPIMRKYGIGMYISDNASTDNTKEVVEKWQKEYSLLYYHCNEENLGPDANFEIALKKPAAEYVWLLGDTYKLPESGVEYLLNLLEGTKNYDAIVFNLANKISIATKDYDDHNELLADLAALMSCLSCLVYSKQLINKASFTRYYKSYFIQTGIIFEYIAKKEFLIHWVSEGSVEGLEHPVLKKKNWSNTTKAFDIGCEAWANFVMSLPTSYAIENKMKCIMDFGKVSALFTLNNLFMLRIYNLLNYKVFIRYKKLFNMTIDFPISLIFVIALTPRYLLKIIATFAILLLKQEKYYKINKIWKNN